MLTTLIESMKSSTVVQLCTSCWQTTEHEVMTPVYADGHSGRTTKVCTCGWAS